MTIPLNKHIIISATKNIEIVVISFILEHPTDNFEQIAGTLFYSFSCQETGSLINFSNVLDRTFVVTLCPILYCRFTSPM